ncbi:hypothetical protein ACF0H5_006499 [Mactra antiquata]
MAATYNYGDSDAQTSSSQSKSHKSTNPEQTSNRGRTLASPSPERVIQRKSSKKKLVLIDRVKKAKKDPVSLSNRYGALSESDVLSMEDEDMCLSLSTPISDS